MLVSERVSHFYFEGARLEYTEYGAGDRLVLLLHGQLMTRRMHDPLARRLAAEGYRVVTLDLLGHGRSDRPTDPRRYSMPAFAAQVMALMDHLDVSQAVLGGTSLGANVTLEVAVAAPEQVLGMVLEMPVLDNAVEAGIVAFGPMIFLGRVTPWAVSAVRAAAGAVPRGLVPFWVGVGLDNLCQQPAAMAAAVHGIFFGRIAPSSQARREIQVPAVVIGHPHDPVHPAADAAMLSEELPDARFVAAESIIEWRARPDRITGEVLDFLGRVWPAPRRVHKRRSAQGTMGG
ncbi:MAG: alpha/beta fold hydrolase [Nocardioidaceae bacterium]